MNKYFVLYCIDAKMMEDWMKNTDPKVRDEQSKNMMKDMDTWMAAHKKSFVGKGSPLGKTKRVTKDGISDVRNDLNYSCIVEAESHEAAAKMFVGNPHIITIPTSYIDVMEIPHMGM